MPDNNTIIVIIAILLILLTISIDLPIMDSKIEKLEKRIKELEKKNNAR
jgi:hypothetical protein